MEQRIKKPTLSLRNNLPASNTSPTSNVDSSLKLREEPNPPHEYPESTQECFPEWDIPVIEDVEPKRRKRRKDKHIEKYRKEARWQ